MKNLKNQKELAMETFLYARNYSDKRSKWAEFNNILFMYHWFMDMERPAQIVTWKEIVGGRQDTVKPCILVQLKDGTQALVAYYTQISSYKMLRVGNVREVLIGENSNHYNAYNFTKEICKRGYV